MILKDILTKDVREMFWGYLSYTIDNASCKIYKIIKRKRKKIMLLMKKLTRK